MKRIFTSRLLIAVTTLLVAAGSTGEAQAVGRGSVSVTFSVSPTGIRPITATENNGDLHAINGIRLKQEPEKGVFIRNGKKHIK